MGKAAILSLGSAVPAHRMEQAAVGRWMAEALREHPTLTRWLEALYARSEIQYRHTCIPDLLSDPEWAAFGLRRPALEAPSTADRMEIYRQEAVALGVAAAGQAVSGEITHLIAVSCTGFFAPGLDLAIARALGLPPTVKRTLVGFMGCAAAFNALRLASEIVAGAPAARVLVVCVELCTIHLQPGTNREGLVAASLFGDGAAACVVGRPLPGMWSVFHLGRFLTHVTPDTAAEMVWEIGNQGFSLRLSPEVPSQLAAQAPALLRELQGPGPRPRFWAIHPGGRAILDRIGAVFGLTADQVAASRSVLRQYGNMSSATILFVLGELQRQLEAEGRRGELIDGIAMAFGPGLVTEMARMAYIPAGVALRREEEMLNHVGD